MTCWSCDKEIPSDAKFCPHCEAAVMPEPSADDTEAVAGLLQGVAPELVDELRDAFEQSSTGEEFVNLIMVGDCPKCASANTGDCENDPEIDDPCIGRCFDCGQIWCLDCGELFKDAPSAEHDCPFWEEMGLDDDEFDELDDLG